MRHFDKNELSKRVDEVLFYKWDPIGVSDEPCARGEYESYVQKVRSLVEKTNEIEPIASYLESVVKDMMGMKPNRKHSEVIAELLLEHKHAIHEGLA